MLVHLLSIFSSTFNVFPVVVEKIKVGWTVLLIFSTILEAYMPVYTPHFFIIFVLHYLNLFYNIKFYVHIFYFVLKLCNNYSGTIHTYILLYFSHFIYFPFFSELHLPHGRQCVFLSWIHYAKFLLQFPLHWIYMYDTLILYKQKKETTTKAILMICIT